MRMRNVVLCAFAMHLRYTKECTARDRMIVDESKALIQRGNDVDKGVTRSRSYTNGGVPDDARAM